MIVSTEPYGFSFFFVIDPRDGTWILPLIIDDSVRLGAVP